MFVYFLINILCLYSILYIIEFYECSSLFNGGSKNKIKLIEMVRKYVLSSLSVN